MLTPYRRHSPNCKHADKGAGYQRCSCPIWVDGLLKGQRIRRSLSTRDWARALDRIRIIEQEGDRGRIAVSVENAISGFLADRRARNLEPATLKSYKNTLDRLARFFDGAMLSEITVDRLARFRESREVSPGTARKELEYQRTFFNFCGDRGWIEQNPARRLKPPKDDAAGALPFEPEELKNLFAALDTFGRGSADLVAHARARLRALMLLLLHSGLRISDAAALRRDALDTKTGYLTLRTQKTGVPVRVRLPQSAVDALLALPKHGPTFFVLPGEGMKATTNSLWRSLHRLGKRAKVHCHPHRFRDSCAVELLRTGADIWTVSQILGHSSVKTTQRHYAHFVKAHQELLDTATARLSFGL